MSDFCRSVECFISRMGIKISLSRTSSSFFIWGRIDFSIDQKISTESSNTCVTGDTAFRERDRQRYCFVACRNGVISSDVLDGIAMRGLMKRSECDLSTVKTRWSERSFVRIAWDRRSRSLIISQVDTRIAHFSVTSGFMLNLQRARNTKNASLTNKSSTGIGRPRESRLPSLSSKPSGPGPAPGGCGVSSAVSLGTGIDIVSAGKCGVFSPSLSGGGAVGIESLGLGLSKDSLSSATISSGRRLTE